MPMKIDLWESKPIKNEIILNLVKSRGEMLTSDLFRIMSNIYTDFTRNDLMDNLFRLEVRGIIFVSLIKKDLYKVEINPRAHLTDDLMEQIKDFHTHGKK
jgi:hypothetical protein